MKNYFLLFFFLTSLFGFSLKKSSTISWKKLSQLEWDDFKAKPNKASSFKALTASAVSFGISYENSTVTIEITNEFDPKKSWTKVREEGSLLNHQRLHFDISELFARGLRKKILDTTFKNLKSSCRNKIIKAQKAVKVKPIADLDVFYNINQKSFKRQNIDIGINRWIDSSFERWRVCL